MEIEIENNDGGLESGNKARKISIFPPRPAGSLPAGQAAVEQKGKK